MRFLDLKNSQRKFVKILFYLMSVNLFVMLFVNWQNYSWRLPTYLNLFFGMVALFVSLHWKNDILEAYTHQMKRNCIAFENCTDISDKNVYRLQIRNANLVSFEQFEDSILKIIRSNQDLLAALKSLAWLVLFSSFVVMTDVQNTSWIIYDGVLLLVILVWVIILAFKNFRIIIGVKKTFY